MGGGTSVAAYCCIFVFLDFFFQAKTAKIRETGKK
jgi:hypothetical protein